MDHVIPSSPCSNLFFYQCHILGDESVRSDTVITCIGSRVQENVLQFGQNHQTSPYLGVYFWTLNPLIGIKLPKIYCYMSVAKKYIDINTNSKN